MSKRTILFIGRFFPKKLYETILKDSKGKIVFSNHNFEMSLLSGLEEQKDIKLTSISCPSVYTYPYHNNRIWTKSEEYENENNHIKTTSFCNLPIINKLHQVLSLSLLLLRYYRNHKDIEVIINTPSFFLMLGFFISKVFTKRIKSTTLIIPDIPSMVTILSSKQSIKTKIVGFLNRLSNLMMNKMDKYVLLTDAMKDFIKKDSVKYIVMEGLIDIQRVNVIKREYIVKDKNVILYTGSLYKIFGIMNLIEAFIQANLDNTELWICGSGEAADEIKEIAKNRDDIVFYGLVDSKTALNLQQQATILVNPRTSQGDYTKYSFPSKTIEYLLSGKVVVANRLPGIPNEYYEYIITPKNETISELSEVLKKIVFLSSEERAQIGIKGREFIIKNKNAKIQTRRILDMN